MKFRTIFIILAILCLFPKVVYGSQDVIVSLNVHKITINCNTNFKCNNEVYEKSHEFFIKNGGYLNLEIMPIKEEAVSTIICNGSGKVNFDSNILKISNVYGNMNVDIVLENKENIFEKVGEFLEKLTANKTENISYVNEKTTANQMLYEEKFKKLENVNLSFTSDETKTKNLEIIKQTKFDKLYVNETLNGRCLYEHYLI